MTARDWLLVYVALKGAPQGLDPVRIQKGMFLFSQEAGAPREEVYDFGAYQYGPMSSQIYSDIERLEVEGLVRGEPVPGYSWKRYTATAAGIDLAREILEGADGDVARQLTEIKREVAGKTFNALLRDVYARYPEYARRSVFSG